LPVSITWFMRIKNFGRQPTKPTLGKENLQDYDNQESGEKVVFVEGLFMKPSLLTGPMN